MFYTNLQATRAARASRGRMVVVAAADRPTWFPGVQAPTYLTNTLPGKFRAVQISEKFPMMMMMEPLIPNLANLELI